MSRRLPVLVALAIVTTTAATAGARSTLVTVHRGQAVRLNISTRAKQACLASVTYANGETQNSGSKRASAGHVSWLIRIPNNAAIGIAHWTVKCGTTFRRVGAWNVAAPTDAGPSVPSVLVAANGFSQRPDDFGTGSKVSFGMYLRNTSSQRDAENIYLLVNFVDANGVLLGSMSKNLALVAAGQTFAYGDEMTLRTQALVTKLEITIRVGNGAPAVPHPLPHFANIAIIPDSKHPEWLSEVDGEVANDTSPATMSSAQLSMVVLDATGTIVGGGRTSVVASLPSGSREVFITSTGIKDIPTNKAASVVMSSLPQYQTN